MKKALFILFMLLILGIVFSYAQCGQKQFITASKTEYLKANGEVEKTVDEPTIVEFNKTNITITHGVQSEQMSGIIKSDTCNWKVPFKEGRTVLRADISDPTGEVKTLTITIEGKEGKFSFLAEADGMPDRRIRLVVEKFEEKK
jgi:hypothetical protein